MPCALVSAIFLVTCCGRYWDPLFACFCHGLHVSWPETRVITASARSVNIAASVKSLGPHSSTCSLTSEPAHTQNDLIFQLQPSPRSLNMWCGSKRRSRLRIRFYTGEALPTHPSLGDYNSLDKIGHASQCRTIPRLQGDVHFHIALATTVLRFHVAAKLHMGRGFFRVQQSIANVPTPGITRYRGLGLCAIITFRLLYFDPNSQTL